MAWPSTRREVAVAKMYERVKLVRPVYLDFTGVRMEPGTEAIVIDLLDDDVVLIEFDIDDPELVGGKSYGSTAASIHDLVTVQ